jgi:hypothetical protein
MATELSKFDDKSSEKSFSRSGSSADWGFCRIFQLFEAYMELKCEPIVAIIEPSMYTGKFDWARCPRPSDARDYVKVAMRYKAFFNRRGRWGEIS